MVRLVTPCMSLPDGFWWILIYLYSDSWARRALWKDGLDYRHGTGHGVGHFLNVHEGPHGIGTRISQFPYPSAFRV